MRCSKAVGRLDLVQRGRDRVGGAAMAAAGVRDQESARLVIRSPVRLWPVPSSSARRPRIPRSPARRSEPGQECPSRGVVEAENVAKLDIGVSVMAVVVLGEHDAEGAQDALGARPGSASRDRSCGATRRGAGPSASPASGPRPGERARRAAATTRYGSAPRKPSSRTAGSVESTA